MRDRHAGHLLPAGRDLALHGHAAAHAHAQRTEVEVLEARLVQQRIEQRVDTGHEREPRFRQQPHERLEIARIGDQQIVSAELDEAKQIRRERVHVVQRQRRQDHTGIGRVERLGPCRGLEHVGYHAAMRQHRALWPAGRAARVLQERDVVACERGRIERQ